MIVLDTHVWVWWLSDPDKLPRRTARAIEEAVSEKAVYLSAISTWEIAMLVARNRLEFTMDVRDWVARSEALPFLQFVPVDNLISIRSVDLPESFHKDPADRFIVATALTIGAPLATADRRMLKYRHVKTIWK